MSPLRALQDDDHEEEEEVGEEEEEDDDDTRLTILPILSSQPRSNINCWHGEKKS